MVDPDVSLRSQPWGGYIRTEPLVSKWEPFEQSAANAITELREKRRLPTRDVRFEGAQGEIERFVKAFGAKPAAR
jgi:hypothetical protein